MIISLEDPNMWAGHQSPIGAALFILAIILLRITVGQYRKHTNFKAPTRDYEKEWLIDTK